MATRTRGEHGEPSGPGLLRVLAVAFGVGVASAYVFDLHSHTCSCGKKWRHFGSFNEGDLYAHTCPRCGQVQWWKDCPHHHVFPHDDVPASSAEPALPLGPGTGRT